MMEEILVPLPYRDKGRVFGKLVLWGFWLEKNTIIVKDMDKSWEEM